MWLVHRGGFSSAKRLARTPNGVAAGEDSNQLMMGEGKVKVKLEQGEEVLEVEEEDVEKVRLLNIFYFFNIFFYCNQITTYKQNIKAPLH